MSNESIAFIRVVILAAYVLRKKAVNEPYIPSFPVYLKLKPF